MPRKKPDTRARYYRWKKMKAGGIEQEVWVGHNVIAIVTQQMVAAPLPMKGTKRWMACIWFDEGGERKQVTGPPSNSIEEAKRLALEMARGMLLSLANRVTWDRKAIDQVLGPITPPNPNPTSTKPKQ